MQLHQNIPTISSVLPTTPIASPPIGTLHPATPAPTPYRFLIEAILFLTYAAFGLSWIAITPLLTDLQTHFSVDNTTVALLYTAVAVAKVIAPLLTGLIATRLGARRTLLAGSTLIAIAALSALSPRFGGFVAGRFLFGLGGAVVVTLLAPTVMRWFPRGELPVVNALNNVAVNTGVAATLFLTGPLATRIGWRGTLLLYAGVSALFAAAWAIFGRCSPPSAPSLPGPASHRGARFADVWRMRETWLIALAFTAPLALYLAFNTWLPRYYLEARHFDRATATGFTGLFNLVGIPAAIAGGLLTRRLGLRRPLLVGAGLLLCFSSLAMLLLASPSLLLCAAILLGVALFIAGSALITTAMELPGSTPERVGLVMATMLSTAYLASAAAPLVVGWLRDRTGSFLPGLVGWAAFSSLLAVAGWLLPETGPARRKVF
jgi:cyanate permease